MTNYIKLKKTTSIFLISWMVLSCQPKIVPDKSTVRKGSIVYRITYRDTTIYRFDTIRIKHYIHSDTLWAPQRTSVASSPTKRNWLSPSNFGIGPSVGAYWSPINGFDLNLGFSIQYYILSIPSFRRPHTSRHRNK